MLETLFFFARLEDEPPTPSTSHGGPCDDVRQGSSSVGNVTQVLVLVPTAVSRGRWLAVSGHHLRREWMQVDSVRMTQKRLLVEIND